jgi:hypothetical protein
MDYHFKDFMTILEIEGSKEVRVALGPRYLRPCLGHGHPRGIKFPVRSMSSGHKEI